MSVISISGHQCQLFPILYSKAEKKRKIISITQFLLLTKNAVSSASAEYKNAPFKNIKVYLMFLFF